MMEQVVNRVRIAVPDRDTDACRQIEGDPLMVDRTAQGNIDPFGKTGHGGRLFDLLAKNKELVARKARHGIARPDLFDKAAGHGFQAPALAATAQGALRHHGQMADFQRAAALFDARDLRYGVFKPVHDAYHSGKLKSGMIAVYTDGAGKAHRYRLSWVQDVPIATWGQGSSWAATSGPVITLQTCDGASDNFRIMVRFVPA